MMKQYRKVIREILQQIVPDRWQLPCFYWQARMLSRIEPELFHLRYLAKREGIAVDVGANQGLLSYGLSCWFKKVIAFEPNPRVSWLIKKYDSPAIQLHQVALSDSAGRAELKIPVSANGMEYAGWGSLEYGGLPVTERYLIESIDITTLDSYQLGNVAVIKIDAEGHEINVLRGAIQTILRHRPVIMIEVKMASRSFVDSFFNDYGYRLYCLRGNRLSPLEKGWVAQTQIPENIIASPLQLDSNVKRKHYDR